MPVLIQAVQYLLSKPWRPLEHIANELRMEIKRFGESSPANDPITVIQQTEYKMSVTKGIAFSVFQIVRSSYKVSPDWLDKTIENNRFLKIQNGGGR